MTALVQLPHVSMTAGADLVKVAKDNIEKARISQLPSEGQRKSGNRKFWPSPLHVDDSEKLKGTEGAGEADGREKVVHMYSKYLM